MPPSVPQTPNPKSKVLYPRVSQFSNQVLARFVSIFLGELHGPVADLVTEALANEAPVAVEPPQVLNHFQSPVLGGTFQGPSPENARTLLEIGVMLEELSHDVAVPTDGSQLQGSPPTSTGGVSVHVGIMGNQ
ncbi:hypothetical protein PG994_004180 [Apiospora phragmitis]|uniref:Uncharacterized protein n=1 Tax=Apiospora phragmitis TaxID=2905665 RepID=A0ABR1VSK0_9PEZI